MGRKEMGTERINGSFKVIIDGNERKIVEGEGTKDQRHLVSCET